MKVDNLRSWLASRLPGMYYWAFRSMMMSFLWHRLYRFYQKGRLPVRVRIHGRWLFLKAGDPYPFLVVQAPHFNSGLIAAVKCLRVFLGRPLRVLDLGAGAGDTVALLSHNIPDCFERCLCVDGDPVNRLLLEANMAGRNGVAYCIAMLSASTGLMSSLVRHHPGTASAVGSESVQSLTLDELLSKEGPVGRYDFIKIDLDGHDGDALQGSSRLLAEDQPLVIFEWHPQLISKCGKDPKAPFLALSKAGYRQLIWFTNRGIFSHRSTILTTEEIKWWSAFLIAKSGAGDPHFDIIALPQALEQLVDPITRLAVYPG